MNGPTINGEPHVLIVLRVLEKDAFGRPSKVLVGYDDTTFNLAEDTPNEFITAFVKSRVVEPQTKGTA